MLRKIAKARTEDEYENALNDLKTSKVWKTHEKLRNWITGTWLNESKVRKLTKHRTKRKFSPTYIRIHSKQVNRC